jgi:hypothetical protein
VFGVMEVMDQPKNWMGLYFTKSKIDQASDAYFRGNKLKENGPMDMGETIPHRLLFKKQKSSIQNVYLNWGLSSV